ncbi:hypothetical protein AKJ09_09756 [Labilithrix luteola]|uniref:Glycosyltransferase 2-like domain-containing protein n=1 Tax=Labilithrix luteola TaxID=1391654 RepID=A0A0K1QBI3_9BACT|nr:glycosyltransferase family 2 protein [Labilithrix luteola]AKV03093.1 hypothetical protein AKJ09_09756 [Labilithrix luteola]
MADALDVSVVIPTFEMASHLPALWSSLDRSGVLERVREVVIVDDGSNDGNATRDALDEIARGPRGELLKVVHLPQNVGRFRARLTGAKAARGERVLFLDTRLVLPDGFGAAVAAAGAKHRSVMGHVDIDVTRNVFCLYWDRSHKFIFRRHFRDTQDVLILTAENYDRYLKGTTVFLCERELFIRASECYDDLLSDDTMLMKDMVATTPIAIDPSVRIQWVPRENARDFLARLWERGPGFVEYHVIEHQGRFFWFVVAGGVVLLAFAGLAAIAPPVAAVAAAGGVLATAASTGLFAQSIVEFVKMAPLHVAVVGTFGAAAVRGLGVNAVRALSKRYGRANPSAAAHSG